MYLKCVPIPATDSFSAKRCLTLTLFMVIVSFPQAVNVTKLIFLKCMGENGKEKRGNGMMICEKNET